MTNHLEKYWLSVIGFLLISVIAGGIVLAVRQAGHRPVEISLSQVKPSSFKGEIYIGGAVVNPGFYPVRQGETTEDLIQAAGLAPDADIGKIRIHVPNTTEDADPQRINLNRADAWLLDALPGIGSDRAQAIVDYRKQNGAFHRIEDLLNIAGIGRNTLDKMRDLITVGD